MPKRKAGTMFEQQSAQRLSNYLLLEAVHTDMNSAAVQMAQITSVNSDSDIESVIYESTWRGTHLRCLSYNDHWVEQHLLTPFHV